MGRLAYVMKLEKTTIDAREVILYRTLPGLPRRVQERMGADTGVKYSYDADAPLMNNKLKHEWAEQMADRISKAVDRLARAHGVNDELLAESERVELWVELTALIAAIDTRTHIKPD